jgi:exopolyphosphatase/pppGpp-phosphohydrolase
MKIDTISINENEISVYIDLGGCTLTLMYKEERDLKKLTKMPGYVIAAYKEDFFNRPTIEEYEKAKLMAETALKNKQRFTDYRVVQ